ncbi:phytosulfokine receptor 2-like protein [Corchorus olitorius]|uniref:Phytosulfokine receptor 2-like protein n=1 Tax=Corchorus olitorius TaxID=93759 RepID=A0A1R3KTI7_9ROSI|nr:phytosulfokine receptor 2-like protein [Corchorus olitorius]
MVRGEIFWIRETSFGQLESHRPLESLKRKTLSWQRVGHHRTEPFQEGLDILAPIEVCHLSNGFWYGLLFPPFLNIIASVPW